MRIWILFFSLVRIQIFDHPSSQQNKLIFFLHTALSGKQSSKINDMSTALYILPDFNCWKNFRIWLPPVRFPSTDGTQVVDNTFFEAIFSNHVS